MSTRLGSGAAPEGPRSGGGARASWKREQGTLGALCDFPGCQCHAALGARMCEHHVMVRLASNGSWVDDTHADGGHG